MDLSKKFSVTFRSWPVELSLLQEIPVKQKAIINRDLMAIFIKGARITFFSLICGSWTKGFIFRRLNYEYFVKIKTKNQPGQLSLLSHGL